MSEDVNAVDNSAKSEQLAGASSPTDAMTAGPESCELDEELELRFGPRRCERCR